MGVWDETYMTRQLVQTSLPLLVIKMYTKYNGIYRNQASFSADISTFYQTNMKNEKLIFSFTFPRTKPSL